MMELKKREEIIKALECCGVSSELRVCTADCPYFSIPLEDVDNCNDVLARDALALIKELTEDVQRVSEQCGNIIVECDERDVERLKQVAELAQCCTKLETLYKIERKRVDTIKADTVHKMQSMIKEECIAGGIYPAFVARVVERVGNKLLED